MALTPGTRLGPYAIEAPLGAGGMGEVYRARDTRLDRTVAVKVLPSHLSGNSQLRQRFEREARAVSSLNHPNICSLYDIGQQDGVDYLVMEHLEGETLAARIEKGPLPLDQALRIAVDVADALDRAHRSGIVHRDLKPGNVMLSRAGTKLLDFGLAKGLEAASPTGLTASPTLATPLTTEGAIVGTFQYMAPEQLEGKDADVRSDIFAFGALLYELLTGRKAFHGKTQASLIASILKEDPRPIEDGRATGPTALDRLVRQCLAKDPDDRWQSAGDLRRELEWIRDGGGLDARDAQEAAPGSGRPWLIWAGAPILAVTMLALGWALRAPSPDPGGRMRVSLVLPIGTIIDSQNAALALSPDGTRLAYTASGSGGQQQVFIRPLDSLTAQPLTGTEGATYPFWSPDGRSLGFFADRKLKRVPSAGGTVQTICDAADGRGASWSSAGVIVFAPAPYGALSKVSASGGAPAPVTTVQSDIQSHRNPRFLPDGRRLLFFAGTSPNAEGNGIHSLDLESGETRLVAAEDSEGIYVDPGYLVFVRDRNLMAQPIDASTLALTGEPVPIAEKVDFNPYRWTGAYTVSGTGLLLFRTGGLASGGHLSWFDLEGKELDQLGDQSLSFFEGAPIAITPDGKRAAVSIRDADGRLDMWLFDLARAVGTRFTFGPQAAAFPVWSPDGRDLAYGDGQGGLSVRAADGASEPRVVFADQGSVVLPTDWSPDGESLVIMKQTGKSGFDIMTMPLGPDSAPRPLIATQANESLGRLSPDGQWISWLSDESGRQELFVAPYPGLGGKWQISSGGASFSFWRKDGRGIIYVTAENRMMAVDLRASGESLEIGASRALFGGRPVPSTSLALAPDDERLLSAVPVASEAAPTLTLVTNWARELAEQAAR